MGSPAARATEQPPPGIAWTRLTLRVGEIGDMTTRNPLPVSANTVPTTAVLYRIYDTVIAWDPVVDQPLPYIGKGMDVNQDGTFGVPEYNVWWEDSATDPLNVTVYYDFNGVRWHDGVQLDVWDLLFSYHLNAMNPRFNGDLRVLYCGAISTYDSCGRQLGVRIADSDGNPANGYQRNWEGEGNMPGGQDNPLRVGVQFTLNQPFALFYGRTLAPILFPMHEWSRTGGSHHPGVDFGCAIWLPTSVATSRGIPECATTDPSKWGKGIAATEVVTGSSPYQYPSAESWAMADGDVIGHGPFRFQTWVPGVEADVVRNEDFFTGVDAQTGVPYDPRLASVMKKPTIDGIRFLPSTDATTCAYALNASAVDFCHAYIPPTLVPDLLSNSAVALMSNAEPGYAYMAYNMRNEPWGYKNGDPAQGDIGYWLRQAIPHLTDKAYFVNVLLQGFGIVGQGFVSPANTFWYNDNIPKPGYDVALAASILDSPPASAAGIGSDPPGACSRTTPDGCRQLPGIGNTSFEILAPDMTYDPVRATAGAMIAASMRAVGLNANVSWLPFLTLLSRINSRSFDMFILAWRIGGTDPDYLWDFFDGSNAASGQNYAGFNNATFDAVIEASRAEMDRTVRRTLIFQAQSILADARPSEALYYRTNIEAYRQDRFVNWTTVAGSIWTYWSLLGIHPPAHTVTVNTSPPGLAVLVDGVNRTAPFSSPCFEKVNVTIGAPSPQGTVDTRYAYRDWSDGGAQSHQVPCDADATYTATFEREFRIVLGTNPTGLDLIVNGTTLVAPVVVWCRDSSLLPVIAPTPQPPYDFANWSDGGTDPNRQITCVAPGTFVANFGQVVAITADTSPPGLQVLVGGNVVDTPFTFQCVQGTTRALDVLSPQATGGRRYVFTNWSDGQPRSHVIGCSAAATYVASFAVDAFSLTIRTSPPGLQIEVDGISYVAPHTFWCPPGSSATLNVPPQGAVDTRYAFRNWSDAGARSHVVGCTAPAAFTANLREEYRITIDTSISGLVVEVNGTQQPAPYSFWCEDGSSASVAVPSPQGTADTRHVFASWSDNLGRSHAITCNAPKQVVATVTTEFRITVTTDPSGLEVNVNGASVTAPYEVWCAQGATISLRAPEPQTSGGRALRFRNWTDGGSPAHTAGCTAPSVLVASYEEEGPPGATGALPWIGGLVAALAAAAVAFLLWRRRKKRAPDP